MATDLPSVNTTTRKDTSRDTFETLETRIDLTAFYGGKERGRCLQLGIWNGVPFPPFEGAAHAHLTVDEAIALRKRLTAFIESDYK